MLTILKNKTDLEIKNVICFYVGVSLKLHTADEVKNMKEEDWSYQDYLISSCAKHKYNLFFCNKETVSFSYINNTINIDDDLNDVHISLNKKNTHNTIIFQGQSNDNCGSNYEALMRAFEYMGFFMLNTIDEIKIASDKYLSANLLASKNIPQPKYCLITKDVMSNHDERHANTSELFWKLIDSIYEENNISIDSFDKENPVNKYVCKILGGSLGIGVFICTRDEIESILQTMFGIDPTAEFIIQEFKENTGDIRVHLLSVDGMNYEVLACMKRNKIKGDFRSNVSLGATTDMYKLNDAQHEIVMKTAAASGCRWVGVDLMECADGSNVVIEYNSSPGVQGISKEIKKNMFDIVFEKIDSYIKKYAKYKGAGNNSLKEKRNCYTEYNRDVVDTLRKEWYSLSDTRQKILEKCLEIQPGMYYEPHGKDSPETGLDCSGLVKYVYREVTGKILPSMCAKYFTSFKDDEYEQIDKKDLLPGDIGIKNESTILNHCGIYAGDNKWFEENIMYGMQLTDYDEFKYFFRVKDIDV